MAAGAGKAAALGGAVAAQGVGLGKAAGAAFSENKAGGMGNIASALMAPVPMIKSAASMLGAKAADAGKGALGKAGDAIDNSVGGKIAKDIAAKSEAAMAAKTETPAAAAGKTADSAPAGANTAAGNPDAAKTTSSVPTAAPSGREAPEVQTIPPPAPKGAATDGKTNPAELSKPAPAPAPAPTLGDKESQLNDTPGGDVSGTKVGASDPHTRLIEAINANMAKMEQMKSNAAIGGESKNEQKPKLSEQIQGLQRFVPQDAASVAAAPITMGHTRD